MARAKGIPGVQFRGHTQVDEPVSLDRFVKGARSVGRDVATDLGNSLQLRFSPEVGLSLGQFPRLFGVALGKADQGPGAEVHGLQLLLPGVGLGIAHKVQPLQALLDVPPKVDHPLAVDLVVQDGVAR